MIESCQNFLQERLIELKRGYGQSVPYIAGNIFFTELPRDFLKDNDYAACCLKLKDRKKKDGRIISRVRNSEGTYYTFTRKRYQRELLYRCFLHAQSYDDLWGAGGLVEQFDQAIAKFRVLADSDNRAIKIELHESTGPSGAQAEEDRKKKRPYTAIIRVEFIGGIYTSWTTPIIPSIDLTHEIQ